MPSASRPAIDEASFDELEALASKLEAHPVLLNGLIMLELSERERLLLVESVAWAAAKAFTRSW